jgi:ADP-dependent NAD(P)H-hydrate dehydratase / NAD(P)H-hydrate epimerase
MTALAGTVPILSCEQARALEATLFAGKEEREWEAMQRAGRAIATAVLRDALEIGGLRANARVLVLVGKGHNGGDALIAAQTILHRFPEATAEVVFVFGERALRPLTAKAWRELIHAANGRARVSAGAPPAIADAVGMPAVPGSRPGCHELCLDGVFGFQFRPPVEPAIAALFERVNALPIRLRAAVDLPSADLFRADFTYATGSVKSPVVNAAAAGRVRYLDLGFFGGEEVRQAQLRACICAGWIAKFSGRGADDGAGGLAQRGGACDRVCA